MEKACLFGGGGKTVKMKQPVFLLILSDNSCSFFRQPVAVIDQVIKAGVDADKTIEHMAEYMKQFAFISLVRVLERINRLKAVFLQLLDQFPGQSTILFFGLRNSPPE